MAQRVIARLTVDRQYRRTRPFRRLIASPGSASAHVEAFVSAWIACGFLAGLSHASSTSYNLASDWSDTANPNGAWSYNAAPGVPLTSHIADIDPTRSLFTSSQPAWAYATYPNFGQIPHFYKIVADSVNSSDDSPIGKVVVHNNDPANSPNGLADKAAGFSWTTPTHGRVSISGDMWEVERYLGRVEDWTLRLNGTAISSGELTASPSITSLTPLNLTTGSGGTAVLTQTVAAGDVLSLEFMRPGPTLWRKHGCGHFHHVDAMDLGRRESRRHCQWSRHR